MIIPIQRPTLHLRPSRTEYPIKLQLHVLEQVTRYLYMANISRMVQGPDIIMLENTRGVEVMHITHIREVVVHVLDLGEEASALGVCVSYR